MYLAQSKTHCAHVHRVRMCLVLWRVISSAARLHRHTVGSTTLCRLAIDDVCTSPVKAIAMAFLVYHSLHSLPLFVALLACSGRPL